LRRPDPDGNHGEQVIEPEKRVREAGRETAVRMHAGMRVRDTGRNQG
jgi:hypothetical protein